MLYKKILLILIIANMGCIIYAKLLIKKRFLFCLFQVTRKKWVRQILFAIGV